MTETTANGGAGRTSDKGRPGFDRRLLLPPPPPMLLGSAHQDMRLVDVVHGDDEAEKSYQKAEELLADHANLKGSISPTANGIKAAAKYLSQSRHKGDVKLTGLFQISGDGVITLGEPRVFDAGNDYDYDFWPAPGAPGLPEPPAFRCCKASTSS
ncbi:hypothetical protein ACFWR9_09600 [Streptomyces sp. NPDC058534]|uniref:hypothetical protein n=1 Tax=Streptomyces sp. NPDC058534 TaxID=3346541 RepID=UPI003658D10A